MEKPKALEYDYDLQVWVIDGVIKCCAHPATMRPNGAPCCNQFRFQGMRPQDVKQ